MKRLLACISLVLLALGCEQVGLDGVQTPTVGLNPPTAEQAEGVEAIALVIAAPAESGDVISVQLGVAAPADDGTLSWAGGVANPTVHFRGESAPLLTTSTPGVFATDNARFRELAWVPGAEYVVSFTLYDDAGESRDISIVGIAPTENHTVEAEPALIRYVGEPIEFTVEHRANGGASAVTPFGSATPTFASFVVASPADFATGVEALLEQDDDRVVVPAGAFPQPGSYRVELHNYQVAWPATTGADSATIGDQSWMAVGRIAYIDVDVE